MKLTRLAFLCASMAIVTLGSVVSTSADARRASCGTQRVYVSTNDQGYRYTYVCDDCGCVLQDVYWTG